MRVRHPPCDTGCRCLHPEKTDGPPPKSDAGPGEAPAKMCPRCRAVIAVGCGLCPDCGCARPDKAPLPLDTRYDVREVRYRVHTRYGADPSAPRTLRVDYEVGLPHPVSEWVCLEHGGYARAKAAAWWRRRSRDPVPESAERAADIAEAGGLAVTKAVTVRRTPGEKYDRIVGWELGPQPEAVGEEADSPPAAADDVPF